MTNKSNHGQANGQPRCPTCGGIHFGGRYDDCPYPELAEKGSRNAQSILAAEGNWPTECIHGNPIDSECERCKNSSLGGRKDGEPMPTVSELEAILEEKSPEHSNDIYKACDACGDPDGCAVAYNKQHD